MSGIDPSLMQAAGFVGAQAQQAVGSATQKAAINTNQLNQSGEQARQGITDQAEASGMLRSSFTNRDLGYQTAEQANKQQMIDLGVNDTIAGANMDVMQALAQQQLQQQAQAQAAQMFDASLALKYQQLQQSGGMPDYEKLSQLTGGAVTGPNSSFVNPNGPGSK